MARTRIGFNIGAWFSDFEDRQRNLEYVREANPAAMLTMEDRAFANDLYHAQKQANPNTEPVIIYRDFAKLGNNTWYDDVSAEDFRKRADQVVGRDHQHLWVYVLNEPHESGESDVRDFSQKLADITDRLCSAGYKIVLGNFSAGTVDHPEWMHQFLRAAAQWGARGQFLMSEHWYTAPIPPHGYVLRRDGNGPADYRTLPIEQSLDHLHPRHWMSRQQVQHAFNAPVDAAPMWHYGRVKRFYQYAREVLGFELPPMVITEGLLDAMGDLQFFAGKPRSFSWNDHNATIYQHIARTWGVPSDVSEIKGDLTYRNMWPAVYDLPFDQAMFLMWSWMDRTMPQEVLGVTLFTASNAQDWDSYGHNFYDILGAWEMMEQEAATRGEGWVGGRDYDREDAIYRSFDDVYIEPAPDTPDPTREPEYPAPVWQPVTIAAFRDGDETSAAWTVNVRFTPSTNATVLTQIRAGDVLDVDASGYTTSDGRYTWTRVRLDSRVGWCGLEILPAAPGDDALALLDDIEHSIAAVAEHLADAETAAARLRERLS